MRLPTTSYLSFPLRIGPAGAAASSRRDHVRELIAQVLLTIPGERLYRPEFGGGVQRLVFEPNAPALWDITRKRITASLAEALRGDVDPKTLEVEIETARDEEGGPIDGRLAVRISYRLASLNENEEQTFTVGAGATSDG